jgi:hypothetical protein
VSGADLARLLAALWDAVGDLGDWVVGPPILLGGVTGAMTIFGLSAAWSMRRHPNAALRWSTMLLALTLLLVYPARTDDPSALGRVALNLAYTLLFAAMCRRAARLDAAKE